MDININLKHTQNISPQMVQSMEILQMGSQELLKYIRELVQENPVVDLEEQIGVKDEFSALSRKLKWLESTDVQNSYYKPSDQDEEDNPLDNYGGETCNREDLYSFVTSQLQIGNMNPAFRSAAVFIIESLTPTGYFEDSLEIVARVTGCTESTAAQALKLVQSLEPVGIGARNLSECLCLQLQSLDDADHLAIRIASDYLEALARNRYAFLARELKASQNEVRAACERIRALNPKPGTGFSTRENIIYITPDVNVVKVQDYFEIHTEDYCFPSITLSSYYSDLIKSTDNNEVKDYLVNKMHQANWVINSIKQRHSTLVACAECIVQLQEEFFSERNGHLVPMTLGDVARQLDVHESTVSRAIRDKYLRCSKGVFPLSYFFSRGLGKKTSQLDTDELCTSPDAVKALISELIGGEDKRHPLSDQKICELLEERSADISRRTVAKYRCELGIPCASVRKQYE